LTQSPDFSLKNRFVSLNLSWIRSVLLMGAKALAGDICSVSGAALDRVGRGAQFDRACRADPAEQELAGAVRPRLPRKFRRHPELFLCAYLVPTIEAVIRIDLIGRPSVHEGVLNYWRDYR
jgi:hypothetical protein